MQQLTDVLAKPGLKSALANLGWLLTERVVRLLLGVVVGFFVARHLGPERFGILGYCTAVVALLGSVATLGLEQIVRRDILNFPDEASALVANSACLRFLAGAVCFGALLFFVGLTNVASADESRLLAIIGLTLFQPALLVSDLWLQAKLQARKSTWAQTIALAIGATARVIMIERDASLEAFAWILVVEMLVAAAAISWAARSADLKLSIAVVSKATAARLLREAWPLIFAGIAVIIYMKTGEIMLRHLASPAEVGLYSAAIRFTEIWYFVPSALASSFLPALLRARASSALAYEERLQRFYDLNAAVAYGVSIPVALAAPWLIHLAYGEAYRGAAPIAALHVWSSIFVFLGVARGQWLVNEGLQHFYFAATLAGAVANVLLNFLLIPHWGGIGAAAATVISYAGAVWISSYTHPAVQRTAAMQTRAVLLPVLGWRYLRG